MIVTPNQITDPNTRAIAQRYSEEFTGVTGTSVTLSYTPATTQDGVALVAVYRNGVLMSEGGTGGGTWVRERRVLTGDCAIVSAAGVATATTSADHTLKTGNIVAISGASPGNYDVTGPITYDATNAFDYPISGSPVSPAVGAPMWAAQSFYLLQDATSAGELLFIDGRLVDPSVYTRSEDSTGTLIDLGSPLTLGQIVVIAYFANGGGYTIGGTTLTFDSALTSSDRVRVDYQYRN